MVDRITLEKSAFNRNKASNRDAKLNHGCHSYPERQYPISRSVGYLRSTPNVVTPEHARLEAMSSNSAFFVIGYGEGCEIDWDRGTLHFSTSVSAVALGRAPGMSLAGSVPTYCACFPWTRSVGVLGCADFVQRWARPLLEIHVSAHDGYLSHHLLFLM